MGYEFQPENTPVLLFKLKAHVPYKQPFWLLWPVYAYRVIAPLPLENKRLNIFQKAVLGFCNIQRPEPAEIGRYLHLDPELMEYILDELHRKDLIDGDYQITPDGQNLLLGEEQNSLSEILTGYVFQDPWTKQLWARVVDKLHYASVEYYGNDAFPTLMLGPIGNTRPEKPFVKRADFNVSWKTPSVQEILNASFRHQRDMKRISSYPDDDLVDDVIRLENNADVSHPAIKKVALISEEPEPYYMATFLYRPSSVSQSDEWYACDPFGLDASTDLTRWVGELMKRDDLLKERVDEWLKRTTISRFNSSRNLSELTQVAKTEISKDFPVLIELMPFYSHMLELVRSQLEIAEVEDPPSDKLRDILLKSAILLEAVLEHIREKFPTSGSTEIYNTKDWGFRQELLSDIARQMGFDTPVPRSFANIEPRKLSRVEKGGGTLGEQVVVSLLSARLQPAHPFWQAARVMPDMLSLISDLSYVRGQSSHHTDYNPSKEDVSNYVETAMDIVKTIGTMPIMSEEKEYE